MMKAQIKKNLPLITLLMCLSMATSWNPFDSSLNTESLDAASVGNALRTTELSKVVPKDPDDENIQLIDPAISQLWGLKLTESDLAWKNLKALGSRNVVVAVIDTGIDVNHPNLQSNLWVNPGEVGLDSNGRDRASNGIDDDGNGFIDDVHGWNFVNNNNDLTDNHGHGTHIAGIIGARGKSGKPCVTGVAPKVSLMVLKYYDPKASSNNNLLNTVKAIRYAVKMNAKIINYSGGGLEPSKAEKAAIAEAQRKGILFVAAAGNERSDSDVKGYYPADYDLDNIISVTAIDKEKNILPTSNYGANSVDIAAPGNNICSTIPSQKFGEMTGTSQATAYVTGVAALIMSKFSDFDAKQVIKHITETGDFDPKLAGKTRYRKRLNTYRALAILDQGVNLTGGVVANTANLKPTTFASDPNDREPTHAAPHFGTSTDAVASFSKAMQSLLSLGAPSPNLSPVATEKVADKDLQPL